RIVELSVRAVQILAFPARRSSDLSGGMTGWAAVSAAGENHEFASEAGSGPVASAGGCAGSGPVASARPTGRAGPAVTLPEPTVRSEERTSEVQSREKLVSSLLLEK